MYIILKLKVWLKNKTGHNRLLCLDMENGLLETIKLMEICSKKYEVGKKKKKKRLR